MITTVATGHCGRQGAPAQLAKTPMLCPQGTAALITKTQEAGKLPNFEGKLH
jgi:hypothetical protein